MWKIVGHPLVNNWDGLVALDMIFEEVGYLVVFLDENLCYRCVWMETGVVIRTIEDEWILMSYLEINMRT